ncbi:MULTISPECIES: PIG-L deacetylase family protein [Pontibacillus]|uniref:PIG-L family deacetylase n=1 Tax=Pontibacillus chungwhensis TaxID=265426 RepID=A0ABY8V1V1_9BACI|nr:MULTISPECIES: PIG-L family deacetylase [Pontibacillus]MCD5324102.1 PIG-L family deacetylase [Pontibacillus sp. HN14]WIF97841.1 PIG-L family deacetylase [Pontibacillus chungwhensis]
MKRKILQSISPIIHPITDLVLERYYKGQLNTAPLEEERVLLLAPHVDDETIGAGGTLRQHIEAGAEATVIFLTNGAGSVSELGQSELIERRRNEAYNVKELLGLHDVRFFDEPDGELASTDSLQQRLKQVIEEVQPDVVYAPVFVDCHSDHIETGHLLRDALDQTKRDPLVRLYEINTALPKEEINCVVDITKSFDLKTRAVEIFESQRIDFDGFLALSRYKAQLVENTKVEAVETFLQLDHETFKKRFDAVYGKYAYSEHFKQVNKASTLLYAIFKNLSFKQRVYKESNGGGSS